MSVCKKDEAVWEKDAQLCHARHNEARLPVRFGGSPLGEPCTVEKREEADGDLDLRVLSGGLSVSSMDMLTDNFRGRMP